MITEIIFLLQVTIGILGNSFLLTYYLVYYLKHILKPTDLIIIHILASNVLILLSIEVPHIMEALEMKHFLSDVGCRLILYIRSVARTVSISTTCFLSVFQAITISHSESCCRGQKAKAAKYIGCSISLLWVFSMIINFSFFLNILFKSNNKNMTRQQDFVYCSIQASDEISGRLYAGLVMCPEIIVSLLIAWSSGSMIVILYRHKHRVQHIHSSQVHKRNSPESRATQNILVLVFTFLAFHTVSSVLKGCIALLYHQNFLLVNISGIISLCFPSLGPFVLMSHYSLMPRFCLVWFLNKTF